jgi:hypothetical protein
MSDCTTNDPNLGTSFKNNLSNITLPTGIEPSLSSFGLSGLFRCNWSIRLVLILGSLSSFLLYCNVLKLY